MTIKKRLFISNLLILVIPTILGLIMVGGTMFAVMEIMGDHDENEKFFYESIDRTNMFVHNWSQSTNLKQMKADLNKFNEMAQRLLDSVNARQKDKANRKELIAGISHDLRTPLTSIKAYVEGLETGVASTPETQKRYLDTIKNKANDLEHIVSLDAAKHRWI